MYCLTAKWATRSCLILAAWKAAEAEAVEVAVGVVLVSSGEEEEEEESGTAASEEEEEDLIWNVASPATGGRLNGRGKAQTYPGYSSLPCVDDHH